MLNEVKKRKPEIALRNFVIVRHPFERLVSAFRDKLERYHNEDLEKDHYYQKYGKQIVVEFRDKALNIFGQEFFDEKHNFGAFFNNSNRKPEMPIFWEFVQFLLKNPKNRYLDPHWSPVYRLCSMCNIDMDFIIKVEHLNEEEIALEKYLGIENLPQMSKFNDNSLNGMNSKEITKLYFESLSKEDVEGLYNLYKYDFVMFDYSFDWKNELFYPLKCDIELRHCTE